MIHCIAVVSERYSAQNAEYFIRVLWGGQIIKTSTPLGILVMIPLLNSFPVSYGTLDIMCRLYCQLTPKRFKFDNW